MSPGDDPTPVIIGVGEVTEGEVATPREPADLIVEALSRAVDDTGATGDVRAAIRRLDVISVASWPYDDLPGLVSERAGVDPGERVHTDWGGNQPTLRMARAAAEFAQGSRGVAAICGGEAFRSLEVSLREGGFPPWTHPVRAEPMDPADINAEPVVTHGLSMPPEAYPLFENAGRVARGESLDEAQRWSADVWAGFSEIAVRNRHAWFKQTRTADEIRTVGTANRMIAFPYPKLMNALMSVNMGSAVLVADLATARGLGVDEDRLVFPWAAAGVRDTSEPRDGPVGAHDAVGLLVRPRYDRSAAMETSLDGALAAAGSGIDDIDLIELYSCFPCVTRMAARHLGIEGRRPLSVTGGLTFFGGAANAYMVNATSAMVRALRNDDGRTGLLYGQGGVVTKHHVLLVGRRPRPGGFDPGYVRADECRQERLEADHPLVPFDVSPDGEAVVETSSVKFGRDGEPLFGYVMARLASSGARCVAHVTDPDDMARLQADDSGIGLTGTVTAGSEGANSLTLVD